MEKFISYSQHADDYIAWQLLGKKEKGLVIEVGAFDGRHLSNSYSLENIGWRSVCIEPNPDIFSVLVKNRPAAININAAIVSDDQISEISFFTEKLGVLSGCDFDEEEIKRRYKNRGLAYESPQEIKVPAKSLGKISEELKLTKNSIDIISIDVEGFEMEVLNGFNLDVYQPGLFIVEANNDSFREKIFGYFQNAGNYFYLGNNFQNLFFIRKDLLSRKIIRNLDFENYTRAKQTHPTDEQFVIDSIRPKFEKSGECIRYQKYLGIF